MKISTGAGVRKVAALTTSIALGVGLAVAVPMSASAGETPDSYAEGRFLEGVLAGIDLSRLVDLDSAEAWNNGSQATMEVIDPLALQLLDAQALDLTGKLQIDPDAIVPLGQVTSGGVLSQYARAEKNGVAMGASGTVGRGGAIGPDNTTGLNSPFDIKLDSLIGSRYSAVLTDLQLQIEALAAQATADPQNFSGDYYIDNVQLKFNSPAVADLTDDITKSLVPVQNQLNALSGPNGLLAGEVRNALLAVNPALNLVGGSSNISATVTTDLSAVVQPIIRGHYEGNGIIVDMATGDVSVNLEAFTGGTLNNKPENYEVLTDATVTQIVSTVGHSVSDLAKDVTDAVNAAIRGAKVDVHADLKVLTPQAPILGQVCTNNPITQIVTPANPLLGILTPITQLVDNIVCTATSTAVPSLETSAVVDLHGTVYQVITGAAPLTATAKVLGLPVNVTVGPLLSRINAQIADRLFDADGAISIFDKTMADGVIAKTNNQLFGNDSVSTVLRDILSIKVNLKETTISGGGMAIAKNTQFTQSAMAIGVVPAASSGRSTQLRMANATVTPDTEATTADDPSDPDDPTTPDDPRDPDNPTTQVLDSTVTAAGFSAGRLAFTGSEIAALIALLIGLLTAGTILAREGYRRSHPKVTLPASVSSE